MPGSTSVCASPRPAAVACVDVISIARNASGTSYASAPHAQLAIPVRGTEDYRKIGEGIWSYAWDVAVLGHPPATPFDVHEAGLAIDPPIHQSQHQVGQSPTLFAVSSAVLPHTAGREGSMRGVASTCCEHP